MFDAFGLTSGSQPKRQTLLQKCSCGAQVEILADAWDPSQIIYMWLQTHPCPNRGTSNPLKGLGRPVHGAEEENSHG